MITWEQLLLDIRIRWESIKRLEVCSQTAQYNINVLYMFAQSSYCVMMCIRFWMLLADEVELNCSNNFACLGAGRTIVNNSNILQEIRNCFMHRWGFNEMENYSFRSYSCHFGCLQSPQTQSREREREFCMISYRWLYVRSNAFTCLFQWINGQ